MLKILVLIGLFSLVAIFSLSEICSAAVVTENDLIGKKPGNSAVLDTGQVVFQFNAPSVEIDGMAWDGTNLWVASDYLDRIWKMDTLGNIIDSIPAPAAIATGLTWDGQYLWCADGGTILIYQLDPATGNVISSIPGPGSGSSCEGLAWMNDTLWNTNWSNNLIWELDPATGSIWGQFPSQGSGSTGLAWDWHDNCLWNSDQGTDLIYKLDPATGAPITAFAAPDTVVQDLTFDGTYLWTCGWFSGIVYKIDIGYVGVEEEIHSPELCALVQSYPNPMYSETEIMYQILKKAKVSLKIYNFTGRLVRTLVNENKSAGYHRVIWDSKDNHGAELPSGIYFYRLKTGSSTTTNKLIRLK